MAIDRSDVHLGNMTSNAVQVFSARQRTNKTLGVSCQCSKKRSVLFVHSHTATQRRSSLFMAKINIHDRIRDPYAYMPRAKVQRL